MRQGGDSLGKAQQTAPEVAFIISTSPGGGDSGSSFGAVPEGGPSPDVPRHSLQRCPRLSRVFGCKYWVPERALRLHKLAVAAHEAQKVLLQHMSNDGGALKLCGAAQAIIHHLHITTQHITSHHITSHHITSHHITSHHIASHRIASHCITSYHITSPHITPTYSGQD